MCGLGNPTNPNFLAPTLNFFFKNVLHFLYVLISLPGCFILHIYTILRLKLSQEDATNAQLFT